MPTIHYNRIWCKTCNNYTLHHIPENTCKDCDTVYSDIMLKDIPKDKLIEQRNRYNDSNNPFKFLQNMVSGELERKNMEHLFSSECPIEIYESDAGQKIIDKQNQIKYAEAKRVRDEQKAEMHKYSALYRNEKCLCGSGKKYKHCCYSRIQSYY